MASDELKDRIANADDAAAAPRRSVPVYEVSLLGRREIAEATMAFDLSRPGDFNFRAGQAVTLTLAGLLHADADPKVCRRTFSIASAPGDGLITVAMRMRNSAFKQALRTMPLFSPIQLAGPSGKFTLDQSIDRPAVLIAGGIGITPFMSMIKEATCAASRRTLMLFYSNRNPASAAFLSELRAMEAENPYFHFIATMSESGETADKWLGERGTIGVDMLKRHISDLEHPDYYIAGPSQMVTAMQTLLTQAGIPKERVHLDLFYGY